MDIEGLFAENDPVKSEIRRFALNFGLEWDIHFVDTTISKQSLLKQPTRSATTRSILSIESIAENDYPAGHKILIPEIYSDEELEEDSPIDAEKPLLTPEDYFMLAKAGLGESNIILSNIPPTISNLGRPEPYATFLTLEILNLCEYTSHVWTLDLLFSRGYSHIVEQILLDRHKRLEQLIASDEVKRNKFERTKTVSEAAFNLAMFKRFSLGENERYSIDRLERKCRGRVNSNHNKKWKTIEDMYRYIPFIPFYPHEIMQILNTTTSHHLQLLAGLNFGYLSATKLHQSNSFSGKGGEYVWVHNEFYTGYKRPFVMPTN